MKSIAVVGCAAIFLGGSAVAEAQSANPARDRSQVRFRVGQMERILEGAAEHGAKGAQDRFKTMMPGDFLLTDDVRVRGFTIGDWGVFFDVQMPPLESTTPWIVRTLDQNNLGLEDAMRMLMTLAQSTNDPATRQVNMQAVERVNLQLGFAPPVGQVQTQQASASQTQTARPQSVQADSGATRTADAQSVQAVDTTAALSKQASAPVIDNPQAAFHAEVKAAIIDAMLEHGASLRLKPEQRLMVAIRGADNLPRLAPGEPESPTIQLTISGADLTAALSGQLTRDEAVKRVMVEEVP